ncbi:MAG: hypothetical protein ACK50J_09645 [Planctomyces sp.]|jgi:hypothetical protein
MTQSPERDRSGVISAVENRLDSLLTEFFRNEMPPTLSHTTTSENSSHPVSASVSLQIPASRHPLHRSSETEMIKRRFAVLTSLALLLFCALVLPTDTGPRQNSATPASSELLPVSSEAGIPATSGRVIGPNGLTIEETDGIDFRPDSHASESEHASPRSK